MKKGEKKIVLITGLSGAGKSCALRALEDINFYCVDNLPVPLIEEFIKETKSLQKIVIGVDIRSLEYTKEFSKVFKKLKEKNKDLKLIFVDASDEILERRFSITRRPHPIGGGLSLKEAINKERDQLSEIRKISDIYIDTTNLSPQLLRSYVINHFEPETYKSKFFITIISFGYSYGIPQNIDILFDVRFLENPYFVPELKDLTGEDERVQDFLRRQKDYKILLGKIVNIVKFYIKRTQKELRFSYTVAVGCTGGMHRSVACAIDVAKKIEELGYNVVLIHRDIRRGEI